MLRYAIDHGVNYLDLGYPYDLAHHKILLQSLSKALKDSYREKTQNYSQCSLHL